MFMLLLFAPLRRIAEPNLFPLHSPEIFLFWETLISITPSGTQNVHLAPREEIIPLGHLFSMTQTPQLFSIALLLTSPCSLF